MKIRLSCLPGHDPRLPRPRLATSALPEWLREMPTTVTSGTLSGAEVRTVKRCPPFVDAMRAGLLFPLLADVTVEGGELSWARDAPPPGTVEATRSPLGVHVPEQATGMPALDEGRFIVKFTNLWTVHLPEGCSMLFAHPANRPELPFRTLTGLVDCDRWTAGFVHFPALWTDPGFEGVLAAGTPVAQGWVVRRDVPELEFGEMDDAAFAEHAAVQERLRSERGVYRKRYRRRG